MVGNKVDRLEIREIGTNCLLHLRDSDNGEGLDYKPTISYVVFSYIFVLGSEISGTL